MVPVEDCIATTGAMTGRRCGGMRGGGIGDGVWGAVKEGEGCKVTVDGKYFGKEVGGVDEAGKEYKADRGGDTFPRFARTKEVPSLLIGL